MANQSNFNPAYFGLGLIPGIASAVNPEGTNNFFSGLKSLFLGTNPSVQQVSRFGDNQRSALDTLLNMGISGLQSPNSLDPISQQATNRFSQETIPLLSERFTGSTGGAQSSPVFAQQLGQAGANLQTDLAANQRNQLMQLLQLGLMPQFENFQLEGSQGLLGPLFQALGRAGAAYATGGGSELFNLAGGLR